jgi:hypothetical protein
MTLSRKDEAAASAIRRAISAFFGPGMIDRIDVYSAENQYGEAGLAVTVVLATSEERVSSGRFLDAITAASTALREIDDQRFPYVTFLDPEVEQTEGARPAA